jgi:hypothetical protein
VTSVALFSNLQEAVFSECGCYRYTLTRIWNGNLPALIFVMLNPSTADAKFDDPTIRRCISFARDRGFGRLKVLNLFAFRATDPTHMKAVRDPVGPDNDAHMIAALTAAAADGSPVIAAWGVHGVHNGRDGEVRKLSLECGVELKCLGSTKGGHPRHPLYVPAAQEFVCTP